MKKLVRIDQQPAWDALCPEWKRKNEPEMEYKIEISAAKSKIETGETGIFRIRLLRRGVPVSGEKLSVALTRDFYSDESFDILSSDVPSEVKTTLEKPGFARIVVSGKNVSAARGIAFSPEKIVAAPEPNDFMDFWKCQKEILSRTPMKVLRMENVRLDDPSYTGVSCRDVQISCAGRAPVSAMLAMPENAEKHSLPIYIFFHGAGVRPAFQPLPWAKLGMIALNVNAHGLPNLAGDDFYRKAKEDLEGYPLWTSEDPENFLFRDMVLRAVRSLEFVKSLPEWDGKHLIVHGGSQGGFQTLAACALDHDVTLAVANAPAMCNLAGALEGRTVPWPKTVTKTQDPKRVRVSLYCDGANFARHAACEGIFTYGYSDCAAVPSSVAAAYHAFAGKEKSILGFPDLGHELSVFWTAEAEILDHIRSV